MCQAHGGEGEIQHAPLGFKFDELRHSPRTKGEKKRRLREEQVWSGEDPREEPVRNGEDLREEQVWSGEDPPLEEQVQRGRTRGRTRSGGRSINEEQDPE